MKTLFLNFFFVWTAWISSPFALAFPTPPSELKGDGFDFPQLQKALTQVSGDLVQENPKIDKLELNLHSGATSVQKTTLFLKPFVQLGETTKLFSQLLVNGLRSDGDQSVFDLTFERFEIHTPLPGWIQNHRAHFSHWLASKSPRLSEVLLLGEPVSDRKSMKALFVQALRAIEEDREEFYRSGKGDEAFLGALEGIQLRDTPKGLQLAFPSTDQLNRFLQPFISGLNLSLLRLLFSEQRLVIETGGKLNLPHAQAQALKAQWVDRLREAQNGNPQALRLALKGWVGKLSEWVLN